MSNSRENLGLFLGCLGVVMFAGTLPAARLAVSAIDPWFLTFGRAAVAGVIALAILIAMRRRLPPRSVVTSLAIAALLVVFGFPLFSTFAMRTVPAAHGGVVLGILPLATAASAAVLAHERPSLGFWLVGALGAALVVGFAFRHGGSSSLAVGDLLLLASIASSALGYTLSGRLSLSMPGWEVICWALVLSLPFAVIGAIVFWPAHPAAVPATAWMAFLYTALVSQLLGFFAWNAGLALGGIARVSQVQLLQPFVIVALAAPINGETIDLETLLFAAAVVGTVAVGRAMQVKRLDVAEQ